MTEYERGLLLALWRLQEAHAAGAAPDQPHAMGDARERFLSQRGKWLLEAARGPRIAALYGNGYDDAARKRATRALARLEGQGLVELWGEQRNVTHCRLTPEGEKLTRKLRGEESRHQTPFREWSAAGHRTEGGQPCSPAGTAGSCGSGSLPAPLMAAAGKPIEADGAPGANGDLDS